MDIYFQRTYASCYCDIEKAEVCEYKFSCSFGEIYYIFLKRKIDSIQHIDYYDILTPYGYGGPVILNSNVSNEQVLVAAFSEAFNSYCIQNNIVCEFVRFHPVIGNNKQFSEMYQPEFHSYNVAVDLCPGIDEIWKNFEHKVRKNVNKARKNELTEIIDSEGNRMEEFLDIYYSTMDRRKAGDRYYFERSFFEQIHNTLKGNFCYIFIQHEGISISAELILLGDCGIMHSFLGGTRQEFFHLRPNDLLKYNVIEWGKKNGFHTYLLGGGASPQDGIYKYKLAFDPQGIYKFYIGKKIYNQKIYSDLCNEKNVSAETAFFPAYRS